MKLLMARWRERAKRRSRYLAVLFGVLLVTTVLVATLVSLWLARGQEIQSWRSQLSNLSLMLSEQTSAQFRAAYLILDGVVDGVRTAGATDQPTLRAAMGSQLAYRSLRDKMQASPHIDVVTIVAANGDVINFSRQFPAPPINLADRDYFQHHLADARPDTWISTPVRNKGNGQWTFYLSRRLSGRKGEFLGLALVGISSTVLSKLYQRISLGEGASITLYRRDFSVLAAAPHQDSLMGRANLNGSSYQLIESQHLSSGVLVSSSPRFSAQGAEVLRMGAARLLEKFPIIVNITVTDRLFLARWRQLARLLGIVAGFSMVAIALTFYVLYRALKLRDADMLVTEQLRDEAEGANRAKSEFLATMSHEIRTPLTAIIGFAELLQDNALRAERLDATQVIVRNGKHLLAIINDILDLSKIEAGAMHIEQLAFSPWELASGVAASMRVQAEANGIAFRAQLVHPFPARVLGDATRWRQIVFNLCHNAVKFTPAGSVELTLWYDSAQQRLVCKVADTGIGMTEAQVARLFQPFSQADSTVARQYGGTGLGLHLVKRLAHKMGGAVRLDSGPGRGSVFEVDILATALAPDAWLPDMALATPSPAPAVLQRRLRGRVMLAEDGADNRRLICAYLESLGLTVLAAEDGAAAVALYGEEAFDLILMDIRMPVMDGIEATARIRAAGFRGPVVALSANVMTEDVAHYLRSGFDYCIGKPVDRDAFFQLLARLLMDNSDNSDNADDSDDMDAAAPGLSDLPEYAALCAMFDARLGDVLGEMEAHLDSGQFGQLSDVAHTLKGSAGSFGRADLGLLAGQVEAAAASGRLDSARLAVTALLAAARGSGRAHEA